MEHGDGENTVSIRRGSQEDVKDIVYVMEEAVRSMERPEWFVSDDETFIREHIEKKGFIMVAERQIGEEGPEAEAAPLVPLASFAPFTPFTPFTPRIGAFLIVKFPGLSEKNLGRTLDMSEEELLKAAHMESSAVLPSWRGMGLQKRLMEAAEKELLGGPHTLLMATVHPENRFSLENFLREGYEVKATVRRYGGLLRHVLLKDVSKVHMSISKDQSRDISRNRGIKSEMAGQQQREWEKKQKKTGDTADLN